jgi:hypothetical protein
MPHPIDFINLIEKFNGKENNIHSTNEFEFPLRSIFVKFSMPLVESMIDFILKGLPHIHLFKNIDSEINQYKNLKKFMFILDGSNFKDSMVREFIKKIIHKNEHLSYKGFIFVDSNEMIDEINRIDIENVKLHVINEKDFNFSTISTT